MSVCQNFLFMARPWMFWGGSDSVTCFCEVSLVKVRRPSDSLILLVACPALYCPLLPFTALYCPLLPSTALYLPFTALYCPLLPFTALYCLLLPLTCPLPHFTALCCPSLPFTILYCMGQWLIKRSGRYRLGYRLGID